MTDSTTDAVRATVMREIGSLPGPRGLPLVGSLLQVRRGRMHQSVERWAREHGPVFRFELGGRRFLAIADHETVAAVLRERPDTFRRSERLDNTWRELGLPLGLFGAWDSEVWKRQRRMVMAGFDPAHVKAYFSTLNRVVERLRGRWQKAASMQRAIDLRADFTRFTVDVTAGLAFGSDVNTLQSDGDVIQNHLDKICDALFRRTMSAVPYWRFVKLPSDRALDRSVASVMEAVRGFIVAARERLRADPALREQPRYLLEAMLAAADKPGSGLSDNDVAGNVLTMLLVGEDTTANTLAWMVYLLSRNPDALTLARDEVQRVIGQAQMTLAQMDQLDYLEACAHETLRLKPVVPFHTYQALCDTVVADVRVPKGTVICTVMRTDSVDDRFFPEPDAFRPQRWLDEAGRTTAMSNAKRVSMPFGSGPRICPGRYLAMLEIKIAMAMLLTHFDIESVDTPDGGEAQEQANLAMAPLGLRMRLRERLA